GMSGDEPRPDFEREVVEGWTRAVKGLESLEPWPGGGRRSGHGALRENPRRRTVRNAEARGRCLPGGPGPGQGIRKRARHEGPRADPAFEVPLCPELLEGVEHRNA